MKKLLRNVWVSQHENHPIKILIEPLKNKNNLYIIKSWKPKTEVSVIDNLQFFRLHVTDYLKFLHSSVSYSAYDILLDANRQGSE
jgi:hypothetical protein